MAYCSLSLVKNGQLSGTSALSSSYSFSTAQSIIAPNLAMMSQWNHFDHMITIMLQQDDFSHAQEAEQQQGRIFFQGQLVEDWEQQLTLSIPRAFLHSAADSTIVVCILCMERISHGKSTSHLGTTYTRRHITLHHSAC